MIKNSTAKEIVKKYNETGTYFEKDMSKRLVRLRINRKVPKA